VTRSGAATPRTTSGRCFFALNRFPQLRPSHPPLVQPGILHVCLPRVVKTFTPPSQDKAFVWAQLAKNVENACIRARKYQLAAQRAVIFLRTQHFRDFGHEVELSCPTHFPHDILKSSVANYRKQESSVSQAIDFSTHDFHVWPQKRKFATEPQGRRCLRAATRSSRRQRVAGQWYVAGLRVAIDMTSRRSEGGKAPGPTRARCILKATQAVLQIATAPTANGMAVTVEILGHRKIRRAVRRRRPQDQLTAKGQGVWCGMGTHDRFSTALFIVS
jgi:hypothetical protein